MFPWEQPAKAAAAVSQKAPKHLIPAPKAKGSLQRWYSGVWANMRQSSHIYLQIDTSTFWGLLDKVGYWLHSSTWQKVQYTVFKYLSLPLSGESGSWSGARPQCGMCRVSLSNLGARNSFDTDTTMPHMPQSRKPWLRWLKARKTFSWEIIFILWHWVSYSPFHDIYWPSYIDLLLQSCYKSIYKNYINHITIIVSFYISGW